MSAVIRDRVRVAPGGKITIVDDRLRAGEEVDVVVRTLDRPASKFLSVAREIRIDAPSDYSVFKNRADKEWSLTDCVSFEIMRERQLTEALTPDAHFAQAGFVALMRPG